jgi:Aerotolerance regulator N-terminal
MIAWQNPALLWALPIAAVPILIHLLRRHRADRLAFPSLRFVRASQSAAVRVRRPSDLLLLLVRVAALTMAVVGAAGPILVTPSRLDQWNTATARALVVDVSDSMRVAGGGEISIQRAAADAAESEAQSATYATRIDVTELDAGVRRAAAWLKTAPPARREVVVISDFQRGRFDARATASVSGEVGIRLVPTGRPRENHQISGAELLGGGRVPRRSQAIDLSRDATGVSVRRLSEDGRPTGLRVVPADASTERLIRVAAMAGTPAGSVDQPVVIRFAAEDPGQRTAERVRPGWMGRTLLRVQDDVRRSGLDGGRAVRSIAGSPAWTVVVRDSSDKPLVAAAAAGHELVLDVAVPADSFFAAFVVRSLLTARRAPADYDEHEIARLELAALSALSRQAAPFDLMAAGPALWRQAKSTDGRWCWAAALLLLAIEQWVRSRAARIRGPEVSRAAA